jgi:predicted transposase YbfD/YdcC
MVLKMDKTLLECFSVIKDQRIDRCKLHKLLDIMFLAICGMLAGAEGWEEIEDFAQAKQECLRKYVPLANGIPSHDTIARVLERINPNELQEAFISWMQSCANTCGGQVVAIDGKTLRRSYDRVSSKNALHLVSAFAADLGVVLGQVATDSKSNEITAIPALLELLELKGSIVTIDAMGCQKAIAAKIQEKKADYVLALKENQKCYVKKWKSLSAPHVRTILKVLSTVITRRPRWGMDAWKFDVIGSVARLTT